MKSGLALVSCPTNTLHDPPADFSVGQGAPTSHSGHYGEEAQRCPALKDAAQRVRYLWDTTLIWNDLSRVSWTLIFNPFSLLLR